MKFREVASRRNGSNPVLPQTLTEAVNLTLCITPEGYSYHKLKCLNRECNESGVSKFGPLPEEISEEVTWKRYEYVGTGKFSVQWSGKEDCYSGTEDITRRVI